MFVVSFVVSSKQIATRFNSISFTRERRYKNQEKGGKEESRSHALTLVAFSSQQNEMPCTVFFFFFFFIYIDDLALFLFPSVGREMMTRRHGQGYWKKALTLKDPRNQMYKISVAVYETHTRLHRQIPVSIALPTHFVTHYSLPRQPGLEK